MENTQQFTSSYNMFTSLMTIPYPSIHALHSKVTIGFSQPDLNYVKGSTVVTTADASSPMHSSLKCLLSHHLDFHQISHSLFRKLVLTIWTLRHIFWKLSSSDAPHFGGVWERLIRSIKNSLYATIGSKALTDYTVNSLLCES